MTHKKRRLVTVGVRTCTWFVAKTLLHLVLSSRRFLACLSRDATGFETTCKIEVAEEEFTAKGLLISDRGYLEIYPYDKWSDKTLPSYRFNEEFAITNAELCESSTSAPLYLSEPDLIGLMDKYGIGRRLSL
mgnify:CR=1 FL=1